MKKIEKEIKHRLLAQRKLTAKQIEYIQWNIEPKFENDCSICRLNTMFSLDVETETAFAKQELLT